MVVDSSVAVRCSVAGGWRFPGSWRLIAPPLLWSEVRSALHEAQWRRQIAPTAVATARRTFAELGISRDDPPGLDDLAWQLADTLGLAKTYDAEFLALASIRGCQVVTADARLRRAGDRLGLVVDPVELTDGR